MVSTLLHSCLLHSSKDSPPTLLKKAPELQILTPYRHHRGSESVLAEGGILEGATLVLGFQLGLDGTAEHSLTLAMDEDNLLPYPTAILLHGATENAKLVLKHLAIAHARGVVQQLVDMEVNLDDFR